MADKILILKPRLDVTFKEGPVPEGRGYIQPIRTHWHNFVEHLSKVHPDALIMERPLWQFSPEMVQYMDADVVYVPHKQQNNFPIEGDTKVRYYMQTVFPWLFSIDPVGWEGGSSVWNHFPLGDASASHFDDLKTHITSGGTKFENLQPEKGQKLFDPGFILFVCQIPHDETIIYHSDVEVIDGLKQSIEYAKEQGKQIVVKGHPVNPGSMSELKKETLKHEHAKWIENVHLHDLMEDASEVHVINSGTGYEAILFEKPVRTYGRCLYENIVNKEVDTELYRKFINGFVEWCYDTKTGRGFERLK